MRNTGSVNVDPTLQTPLLAWRRQTVSIHPTYLPVDAGAKFQPHAFTLIELLVVVAIIGILASIAITNMLLAQIRAKVAAAESEMQALSTALGAYRIDNDQFPPTPFDLLGEPWDRTRRLTALTTPVAYLSTLPYEVFLASKRENKQPYPYWSPPLCDAMKTPPSTMYYYLPLERDLRGRYALFSRGPDKDYEAAIEEGGFGILLPYDATNGTSSNGDIMRFGP